MTASASASKRSCAKDIRRRKDRIAFGTESNNFRRGDDRLRHHRGAGVPDRADRACAAETAGGSGWRRPAGAVSAMVRIHARAHSARGDRGVCDLAHFQQYALGVGRDDRGLAHRHAHHHFRGGHGSARGDRARGVPCLCPGPIVARPDVAPAVGGSRGGRSASGSRQRLPRLRRHESSACSVWRWRFCCCAGLA